MEQIQTVQWISNHLRYTSTILIFNIYCSNYYGIKLLISKITQYSIKDWYLIKEKYVIKTNFYFYYRIIS